MNWRHSGALAVLSVLSACIAAIPADAKQPIPADEVAVRAMVARLYAGYSKPIPTEEPEQELPDNEHGSAIDGYELPYSVSLNDLVRHWKAVSTVDEVSGMGDFDWYCQCQDYDPKKAGIAAQSYKARGKDQIEARIRFTIGWRQASPLKFTFVRENQSWKLDDLLFEDGHTLRAGLRQDISDAAKKAANTGG